MVRITLALLALVLGMNAQDSNRKTFDFKGDALGETFDQFFSRHRNVGLGSSGDTDLLASHGLRDEYEEQNRTYHITHQITHTFYCFLKGSHSTIAGAEIFMHSYTFYQDKLYKIDLTAYRFGNSGVDDGYRSIEDAYTDRFGQPREKKQDAYGEHLIWIDPDHPYALIVKADNGDQKIVSVLFIDTEAEAAIKKQRPKKTDDT